MPSKKTRLLDEASSLPVEVDPRSRNSWNSVLAREQPERHQEMMDLVSDWAKGGEIKRKLRTKMSLFRFLSGRDERVRIDPPVINCSYATFSRFVAELQQGG